MRTMGWKDGTGLGRQRNGIQEPIKLFKQVARRGFGNVPDRTANKRKHKADDKKDMKKRQERQKKVDEFYESLAKVPHSMRWFRPRTPNRRKLLHETAPGEDPSLKSAVDGFQRIALQK